MNLYAIKSKKGDVGFRSVVVVDSQKQLDALKKNYDVEKISVTNGKSKKTK